MSAPATSRWKPKAARLSRLLGRALLRFAFAIAFLWCLGAIWYSNIGPTWLRAVPMLAFVMVWPALWYRRRERRKQTAIAFAVAVGVIVVAWQFKRPSQEGDWSPDMARLPSVSFAGDLVHITDIRNCRYRAVDDFDLDWLDATYDLRQLKTVHFLVEPFSAFRGPAHTMLAFGFEDGRHFAISVELRREKGAAFHPLPGMYKQFELMYVIGSEEDLIQLRTNHRKHEVYFYPIRATAEAKRALLVDMLMRANSLRELPEFYNTFTNSCTTNIVRHVNKLTDGPRPMNPKVLLPAYADELAYDMGLIETELRFDAAREHFRIDEIAHRENGIPFSQRIRR